MTNQLHTIALQVALTEIGHGEEGKNNCGPYIDCYRMGLGKPGDPWCSYFVSWCFIQAAKELGIKLPFRVSGSARVLANRIAKFGVLMDGDCNSEAWPVGPGDVALWSRGTADSKLGHVGIVWSVTRNYFVTVEGNRGVFPSRVQKYVHEFGEPALLGFARCMQ